MVRHENIVTSLKFATDRRRHIEREFKRYNIAFGFFDVLTAESAQPYAKGLL